MGERSRKKKEKIILEIFLKKGKSATRGPCEETHKDVVDVFEANYFC